jgi:hypothetical protein
MKTLSFLPLMAGLCLVGCSQSPEKSAPGATNEPTSSGNPLNAPADYLRAGVKAKQAAVRTADTASLTKAIDMFSADEGRLPKDLNELVEKQYIPRIPAPPYGSKIVYDPSTGTVKVVPQ